MQETDKAEEAAERARDSAQLLRSSESVLRRAVQQAEEAQESVQAKHAAEVATLRTSLAEHANAGMGEATGACTINRPLITMHD